MTPGPFPPDKDIHQGSTVVTAVLEYRARHTRQTAARNVENLVRQFEASTGGGKCDVILMAVPAGKGKPFTEGLDMSFRGIG